MQLVRLVKASDTSELTKLIKKAGIGMTTMPKNRKEVEERIRWSISSSNKKTKNPNKDTYLFVLENNNKIIGISAIYTSISKVKQSVFFKLIRKNEESRKINYHFFGEGDVLDH